MFENSYGNDDLLNMHRQQQEEEEREELEKKGSEQSSADKLAGGSDDPSGGQGDAKKGTGIKLADAFSSFSDVTGEWEKYPPIQAGQTFYSLAKSLKDKYKANMSVTEIVEKIKEHNNITSLQATAVIEVPTLLYFQNHGGVVEYVIVTTEPDINITVNTEPDKNIPVNTEADKNVPVNNKVDNDLLFHPAEAEATSDVKKSTSAHPTNHRNNSISLPQTDVNTWYERENNFLYSYWWILLSNRYYTYFNNDTANFFNSNPEARDVIMSIAFSMNITSATTDVSKNLKIPVRTNVKDSREINFSLIFGQNTDEKTKLLKPVSLSINVLNTWEENKDAEEMQPPAGYRKDYVDRNIETYNSSGKTNKLGTIFGMEGISEYEAYAVKYHVYQYFTSDKPARNQEVDVIVRLPNENKIYYTFLFHPENKDKTVDVTVERIGDDYSFETDAIDIANAPDYPDTKDLTVLKAWLTKRYKIDGGTIAGDNVEAIRENMNELITAKMGTTDWYKNYDILFPGIEAAKARMKLISEKKNSVAQKDVKTFEEAELKYVELSLMNMSNNIIDRLRGLSVIRQTQFLTNTGESQNWSGFAKQSPGTVILFDSAFVKGEYIFSGGKKGVKSGHLTIITHEFGHIASYKASSSTDAESAEAKFDKFTLANGLKPFTPYSQGDPGEFFAEAFQLYYTDPEFLKTYQPKIYGWMDTFNKTGSPPIK